MVLLLKKHFIAHRRTRNQSLSSALMSPFIFHLHKRYCSNVSVLLQSLKKALGLLGFKFCLKQRRKSYMWVFY